ncbi:MAG TPA: hypothetical protein VKT49_14180 [Bryobacteraceae bacterium]|nr:hypothetical protein [Bryobacteraceae bacterium]
MSIRAEEMTSFEVVAAPEADQKAGSQTERKLAIRFWSLLAVVSLFLAYGGWAVFSLSGRPSGTVESNVNLLLLIFYASALPGCAYFTWRQYRDLKKSR